MNIPGLNFGHDAAATVVRKGRVASYILRERQTRVKHAVGPVVETVQDAVSFFTQAGLDALFVEGIRLRKR